VMIYFSLLQHVACLYLLIIVIMSIVVFLVSRRKWSSTVFVCLCSVNIFIYRYAVVEFIENISDVVV